MKFQYRIFCTTAHKLRGIMVFFFQIGSNYYNEKKGFENKRTVYLFIDFQEKRNLSLKIFEGYTYSHIDP